MNKLIFFLSFFISTLSFSTENDILGKWITEKAKNGNQIIVEFYKENNLYFGKIKQLTIPIYEKGHKFEGKEKLDFSNPDNSLKTRPLVGIDFVSNFTYNPDKNVFENGFIYNPENGKIYHCSISFKNINTLSVKGSIDKSGFIGSKQTWRRVK
ncbi:DUF2147 domain-containing protein [uncultured Cetobacterium sp.]|uniref:DUF2147 domain-containing protein n=1 Tax=uncultured Cetobacterium sp. TaxID=527638 RepID=UPI00260608B3|nr:DUF2147 domain-containing protein [uncultured Cetobacterium sp.]